MNVSWEHWHNMANTVTVLRIIISIGLLFVPVFSPVFFVLYLIAGISDMADGTIARKTGTVSDLGSKLDTAADIVMVTVCLIKMIPVLDVPLWLIIWVAVIALIKVISIIWGSVKQKEFFAAHTTMNKITGIVLFVLPLTVSFIDLKYSGVAVCALATVAAIGECHIHGIQGGH